MKKTLSLILALALIATMAVFSTASAAPDKESVIVGCAAEPDCFFPGHTKLNTNMDEVPILHNVYESLIKLGPNNEREPLLATEWSVSDDGKVYTVKLREGVKFSNGNDFNAEDAAFALNLYGPSPNGAAQLGNYDYTEAVDEYTIAIHLTDPYAPFLNALAGRYALMLIRKPMKKWVRMASTSIPSAPVPTCSPSGYPATMCSWITTPTTGAANPPSSM